MWSGCTKRHWRPVLAIGVLALVATSFAGCTNTAVGATRPTPIAGTPTRAQMLTLLAQAVAGSTPVIVSVTTDQTTSVVSASATLLGDVARTSDQILASQGQVKAITFALQRALWTDVGSRPNSVDVKVFGPLFDDYFDRVTDWYGIADVTAATEALLNWTTLTAESAWQAYDTVALRPYYAPFQQWGAPSPTQP